MIRKAKIADVKRMHKIINNYAEEKKMLARSLNDLYEHIKDFFVYEDENGEVQGCCAMHIVWEDLAEIKAMAVAKEYNNQGIGKELVLKCMEEARQLGIKKTFALTYVKDFFVKLGYTIINRDDLPHKVWRECIHCPKFPDCDEIAVLKSLE